MEVWSDPLNCGRIALAIVLLAYAGSAFGQSATPGTVLSVEERDLVGEDIVVQGEFLDPATIAERRKKVTPGGVDLLRLSDIDNHPIVTLSDALDGMPGVVVQDFFGGFDQPRIQIRGSGLQQNPVERGTLFLLDGMPINRADGSYIVGLANPSAAEFIEVTRGYATNRLGATVLGGALNFASPTGSTFEGFGARAQGGSFGMIEGQFQGGFVTDSVDAFGSVTISRRDGFRDRNTSERAAASVNFGIDLTDEITARFFANYSDLSFDVVGPLTRTLLETQPRSIFSGPTVTPGVPPVVTNPGPNVVRDRPMREARQFRIGTRATADFGAHILDGSVGYTYTDDAFTFPIPGGIRETEGGDFAISARYSYWPDKNEGLPLFEATLSYAFGSADRGYFHNIGGARGPQFGANELDASTLALFGGMNIPLGGGFVISPGLAYAYATRDNLDVFGN
ncbi:MAG: TonB-dependent receptor plug domain-containing protein, partial [Pseudomonadota bacterium]